MFSGVFSAHAHVSRILYFSIPRTGKLTPGRRQSRLKTGHVLPRRLYDVLRFFEVIKACSVEYFILLIRPSYRHRQIKPLPAVSPLMMACNDLCENTLTGELVSNDLCETKNQDTCRVKI
jgi:hypothetical protein